MIFFHTDWEVFSGITFVIRSSLSERRSVYEFPGNSSPASGGILWPEHDILMSPQFSEPDVKSVSLASRASLLDELMLLLTKNKYRNGNKCLFLITHKNAQRDARIHNHSIWFKNDKLHNVSAASAPAQSVFVFDKRCWRNQGSRGMYYVPHCD